MIFLVLIGFLIPSIAFAQYLGGVDFYHLPLIVDSKQYSVLAQSNTNYFTGVIYDSEVNSLIFSTSVSEDFIDTYTITMNEQTFSELLATDYAKTPDSILVLINGVDKPYQIFKDNGVISWRFYAPISSDEVELLPSTPRFGTGTYKSDTIPKGIPRVYPPLKQAFLGNSIENIQCKSSSYVLIQKYDGSPACVTESTKLKLIERGWTTKDSSVQKIIEHIKQDSQAVNEVDVRYIETLALMNQTVSNFVYGVEWTSHCCGYSENNNSSEITITFLDSDNQKQLGVTFDTDTMQIIDIQQSNTVNIGKGLSSEPDPYRLIALREFPNESSYYHKINNISEVPYISKINENKTTIITSEQFNELLEWFPQRCLENNSDSYDCSNTPSIFEHDSTKYLIVSHGLDSNEVYCESGLLYIVDYEKEFPDRNVEDFVPVKCVTPPTKEQLFDK